MYIKKCFYGIILLDAYTQNNYRNKNIINHLFIHKKKIIGKNNLFLNLHYIYNFYSSFKLFISITFLVLFKILISFL